MVNRFSRTGHLLANNGYVERRQQSHVKCQALVRCRFCVENTVRSCIDDSIETADRCRFAGRSIEAVSNNGIRYASQGMVTGPRGGGSSRIVSAARTCRLSRPCKKRGGGGPTGAPLGASRRREQPHCVGGKDLPSVSPVQKTRRRRADGHTAGGLPAGRQPSRGGDVRRTERHGL